MVGVCPLNTSLIKKVKKKIKEIYTVIQQTNNIQHCHLTNIQQYEIMSYIQPQRNSMTTPLLKINPKDDIITCLKNALTEIKTGYDIGVNFNPMAEELPIFKDMQKMMKELSAMLPNVNKIKGLR